MQHKEHSYRQNNAFSKDKTTNEHRLSERREKESSGFTYISTVGWICRREKSRREDDKFMV